MTEPQVWVLVGVFAAGLFSATTLQSGTLVRVSRGEIGRADAVAEELTARSDVPGTKIGHHHRDVQYLVKRQFGEPTDREQ